MGPTVGEVESEGAAWSANPFIVIDVDKDVVNLLASMNPVGFAGKFESKAPPAELRIEVGDTLQINVIEQTAGLFTQQLTQSPTQGPSFAPTSVPVLLQPVQVAHDGSIAVPLAGRIAAAGRTPESVREEIQKKLENKAIFPQVQVTIVNAGGLSANSATVGGEVNRAAVIPLQPSGSRLLDLIAEAGGARFPAYETTVYLTRRGRRNTASLQNIVEDPRENIFIYPHDEIYLARSQRTFSVLGASSKVGRYSFETAHLNLAEAVAIGGGFVDTTANPAGVFVFRYEPRNIVKLMKPEAAISDDKAAPVLYRINLLSGNGYFLSNQFEIHDKDIVLLANSDAAQLQKLLTLLNSAASLDATVKAVSSNNSIILSPSSSISTTATTTAQ